MKGDYERAKELLAQLAQQARISPTQPRFWQAGDGRRALVLYGLALLTLLAYALGLIGFLAALRDRAFALTLMLSLLFSFRSGTVRCCFCFSASMRRALRRFCVWRGWTAGICSTARTRLTRWRARREYICCGARRSCL
jgi:hypothetical protein